ncbi:hypothetical protein F5144DRAFT_4691 [Chaetomium tenue]|uniref:Uncharacterized protein n=1 Tax=Chaetomium tenue TaxID=1854479 RepID=A0ACB7PKJ3_9PEZI|nr:hypothetical protein F5144DRAFT_4691 [Chaetomium globosum]
MVTFNNGKNRNQTPCFRSRAFRWLCLRPAMISHDTRRLPGSGLVLLYFANHLFLHLPVLPIPASLIPTMAAVPGPPKRKVNKSPQRLTADILGCKVPTYYNVGKAWNILGYYEAPRPTLQNFVNDVSALWDHQATLKTPKGRKARAYMLDALRTLGFRNPAFHTERNPLRLEVGDQDGSWADLAAPFRGGNNYGKKDAREYLAAVAPRATPNEPGRRGMIERAILLPDFHLFYGFRYGPEHDHEQLRALPVPEGPNSLWHCISYFIYRRHRLENGKPVGGSSLWHYWEVKARIWAYFMQVLKDPSHELWAEYHLMQHLSKTVDPNFGTLSMARSLYAAPSQGKAAYPHEYLLYVIADYFGTKVQVYTSEATERHIE